MLWKIKRSSSDTKSENSEEKSNVDNKQSIPTKSEDNIVKKDRPISTQNKEKASVESRENRASQTEDGKNKPKTFNRSNTNRKPFSSRPKSTFVKKHTKEIKDKINSKLSVIPLGGLDEIGKNCAVIQYDNEMVVVDLGLGFPDSEMHGVDSVIPDFTYINKNIDKLKAVIITHGHEDHIGSLAHFYRNCSKKVPIYSGDFTIELIQHKLKEKLKGKKVDLHKVKNRDRVRVSENIEVEFVDITHSIPDAFVVAIHTPEGTIVHTGDYKFDLTPPNNQKADFFKLAELGEKGVALLMSDSTNANKEGFTPSEITVVKNFKDVLLKAKGRVIVAAFSSHAYRVQDFINAAHEAGRKTALDGRSMLKAFEIGQLTGKVVVPEGSVIPLQQASGVEDNKLLVVCTGTQGETMAAMSRAANGQHRDVKIEEGDVVVMSANSIPGNEVSINRVVNALIKRGAIVYRHGTGGLHVSGHGRRGDIALMFNLIKPKFFMPVHGEYMHLVSSRALAVDFGIKEENVVITSIGDRVVVGKERIAIEGRVESGSVYIDNRNATQIESNTLKDRQLMSKDGLLVIHMLINSRSRKLTGHPEIIAKGFGAQKSSLLIKEIVQEIVVNFGDKKINDVFEFKQSVREFARRLIGRKKSKNPMIVPVVATI